MQPRAMRRAWRQDMKRRSQKGTAPRLGDRDLTSRGTEGQTKGSIAMETETKSSLPGWFTKPVMVDTITLEPSSSHPDSVVELVDSSFDERMTLNRAELQTIVQLAYDQFGMLATPSVAREAGRAPDLLATIRGHVDAAQEQQRANRAPGQCPCDMTGCSDGVPA